MNNGPVAVIAPGHFIGGTQKARVFPQAEIASGEIAGTSILNRSWSLSWILTSSLFFTPKNRIQLIVWQL